MLQLSLYTLFLGVKAASILPRSDWIIPNTSFESQSTFNTYWNYNYPWGNTHNGAAKMDSSHVSVGGYKAILTADYVSHQPQPGINYLSGTINAKELFTVAQSGGYDFSGSFMAPTAKGTWPAVWLTGANQWPPEIDLAEWKGDGNISFSTLGMPNAMWITDNVVYSSGLWHEVLVTVRNHGGVDVQSQFYLDGVLQTTQIGKGIVGQPMWLIIDLQMEGSSGSPGPTSRQ